METVTDLRPIQVGDIFVNSWGYDQTNVDAYQVVRVTAKTVRLEQINMRTVSAPDSSMSARVEPARDDWKRHGEPITKRPYVLSWTDGPEWRLTMTYGSCKLHTDGQSYYSSWYA